MVENSLLLHFLPRSLQLNMSKNNTTEKPAKGSLNPSASDSKKKRKKGEEDAHAIEENYSYKKVKKKKKKSKDYDEISQEPNKRSAGFYQLEDLIAGFLSSRGLSNTLSSFLSETHHEFTRKAQQVKLEDMYHSYCNKILGSPRKENLEEGKVNREISFGKANVDAQMSEENSKKKDNKGKSWKNGNAHVATLFSKTPNGFSKAKAHAPEIDFHRSKKSKDPVSEAVNNFSGLEDGKITEKVNKKLEPVIRTHKSSAKLSNASNKLEQVFDYTEPFYKSKKSKGMKNKEVASDEMNVIDNDKQNGGKKSKKVTTLEEEVQSMKCHALHTEPKKGTSTDTRQDLENPTNIEVSKKENKKKKKTKSDDISPGDDRELGDTGVEITMALRKSGATDSNNEKRESKMESVEDLSVEPSISPNFKVSKEERKKLSQMAHADDKKKNKKVKKALKELQVTSSHVINGGTKGDGESLSEDTGNTQSISPAHKAFEMKRSLINKSLTLEKSSTDTISQNRGMSGKEDGAVETKKHISPTKKEDKQKKFETVNFVEPMLGDNSYWAKGGAENGYGAKAQQVLGQVRGM